MRHDTPPHPALESGGKHISPCIVSILHLKIRVEEGEGRKSTSLQNLCSLYWSGEVKADPAGAAGRISPLFCKSTFRICLPGTSRAHSTGGRHPLQVFLVQGASPKGAKLFILDSDSLIEWARAPWLETPRWVVLRASPTAGWGKKGGGDG